MASFHESPLILNPLAARALACAALLACIAGGVLSGRAGLARLLTEYARAAARLEPTWAAQTINAADAEAEAVRAFLSDEAGQPDAALAALTQATAQRPRDYWLWLELGRLQGDAGNVTAALDATRRAVALAPYYTQPRWQLANMLWRTGNFESAWAEMRRAVASDATLRPAAWAMAWHTYQENAEAVAQVLPITDTAGRLAWAQFLAEHGQPLAADAVLAALGATGRAQRQDLLNALWRQENYAAAYPIWRGLQGGAAGNTTANAGNAEAQLLENGDFERAEELSAEVSFGWRVPAETSGYRLVWDDTTNAPASTGTPNAAHGQQSLRFDFKGLSEPETPVLTQIRPVTPNTRYALSFAVRTAKLLTGGLPLVMVRVAGRGPQAVVLAQSPSFPAQTDVWQNVTLTLTTPPDASAVVVAVQRQPCTKMPCPCFGQLWLDDFRWRPL